MINAAVFKRKYIKYDFNKLSDLLYPTLAIRKHSK